MANHPDELDVARAVALAGGRVAIERYRRDIVRDRKPDGTWVSDADRAAEDEMRARIAVEFPDHNVMGEEGGLTSASGGAPIDDAPTWVLDPIDGTNNYLAGIPVWGTLVALRVRDEAVVGVCHLPALAETYDGALGAGARLNGEPIKVDAVERLGDATVLFADPRTFDDPRLRRFFDALVAAAWRTRGFGDCWGHALVARGSAHVMVEPALRIWDYAALEPIVREAGGRITRIDGSPVADGGSCLTTCGSLHDAVVGLARVG